MIELFIGFYAFMAMLVAYVFGHIELDDAASDKDDMNMFAQSVLMAALWPLTIMTAVGYYSAKDAPTELAPDLDDKQINLKV